MADMIKKYADCGVIFGIAPSTISRIPSNHRSPILA
jgi:hypothetical protein